MAGEFLPPVVTRLEADIGDFAAKIATARALLQGLGGDAKDVAVNIDVKGLAGAAAKVAALGAATKTATAAAGTSIPVWHRWLDLIHFGFAVFGENIVADAIGIAAFGASAVANIGPAVEAVNNLGQTYLYLNKNQMAVADSLTQLKTRFEGTFNQGVFAVYQQGLGLVNSLLARSGGITLQATQAFEQFAAELRAAFGDPAWAAIFGRSSSLVRQDLQALFQFITALIQLIPGLLHDFNFLGIGFLTSATMILRGLAYISEADPVLTRFAYGAYLAYRAYRYLWTGMGTGPGPIQRMVTGLTSLGQKIALTASYMSEGAVTAISYGFGISGLAVVAGATTLGIGALVAAEVILANHTGQSTQTVRDQISALQEQTGAVGDNVAGWERFSQATAKIANNFQQQAIGAANARFGLIGLSEGLQVTSQMYAQASQGARNQANNLQFLMNTYHLTAAQAYALGQAVGVTWNKTFGSQTISELKAYEAAVNAAKNPLTAIAYDWQQASNQALQLDDRVTALTNAFNALLTPFNNVIQSQVTFKNDLVTLTQDLQASSGAVNYNTAAGRASAAQMAQSATDAATLSEQILNQTGSVRQAAVPLQTMINYLESLHSKSSLVAQEIKILQQYIDQLHSKSIDLNVAITTTGSIPQAYYQGSNGHAVGYASGTPSARPGWAMVGEKGPELIHLRGGETIVPNHSLPGYADGAGVTAGGISIKVMLDGRELRGAMAQATYQDNFRNGSRLNGGRPTGYMRPR